MNNVGIAAVDSFLKCMGIKNGAEAPSIINIYTIYSIISTLNFKQSLKFTPHATKPS